MGAHVYQVSSNYTPGVKFDPHREGHKFYMGLYWENFRILPACSHEASGYQILHVALSSSLCQECPNYSTEVKIGPASGVTSFTLAYIGETVEILCT